MRATEVKLFELFDSLKKSPQFIIPIADLVGSGVEVTLEIQAELPDGVSDKTIRDVTDNCRTLRFNPFNFGEA
jgi:hypothetical protein